jgi:hypothetical protein
MRDLVTKLGKVKWWAIGTLLVLVFQFLALPFAQTVRAAPGDTGDPKALMLNYGALNYDGKTYNNKFDQYLNGPVFSPAGTGTCSDSNQAGKAMPQHFLRLTLGGGGIGFPISADIYNATLSTSGTNVTSCTLSKGATITIASGENYRALFFRDGDIIKSYSGSGGQFTKKTPTYNGADELFINGSGQCADIIVSKGGRWYLFAMAAKGTFGLNDAVISESYRQFVNDPLADTNCRADSFDIATGSTYGLLPVPTRDVLIDNGFESNECENWGGSPGMVNLDSVANGGLPPHDWDPNFFNPKIPRWVIKCEIIPSGAEADDSLYTYFDTFQKDDAGNPNTLIDYGIDYLGSAFFDDGYQLVAGMPTLVPNTLPTPTTPPTTGGPGGATTYVCEDDSSGLAHVLCPLVRGLDSLMHWAFNEFILPLLAVPPLTTIQGLQQAWQNVLVIANILFIVVFFIIIFSQATSIGVSNYGIKRMLPRLVMVAVLANISFYLCVFAVDFSNILAGGISSLILLPLQGLHTPTINFTGGFAGILQGAGAITIIGAFIGAQGGLIAAAAALALPLVMLIALTVLALILRLVVIMGFVVFSPIIFIGYILPGTQRLAGRATMAFLNLLWAGAIVAAMVSLGGFVVYIIEITLP